MCGWVDGHFDIFDILLKPPQPFTGLFLMNTNTHLTRFIPNIMPYCFKYLLKVSYKFLAEFSSVSLNYFSKLLLLDTDIYLYCVQPERVFRIQQVEKATALLLTTCSKNNHEIGKKVFMRYTPNPPNETVDYALLNYFLNKSEFWPHEGPF